MKNLKTQNKIRDFLTAPNVCTLVRIAGAAGLLLVRPLSAAFFALYTISGVSDALDGFLARRLRLASELGARLDSAADLLFYAVMLLRLSPVMWGRLPRWIWWLAAAALLLRLCSYLAAAFRYRRFASMHTLLNKLTGIMVFAIPYIMLWRGAAWCCAAVCVTGALASGEELLMHLVYPNYDPNRKWIWKKQRGAEKEKKTA